MNRFTYLPHVIRVEMIKEAASKLKCRNSMLEDKQVAPWVDCHVPKTLIELAINCQRAAYDGLNLPTYQEPRPLLNAINYISELAYGWIVDTTRNDKPIELTNELLIAYIDNVPDHVDTQFGGTTNARTVMRALHAYLEHAIVTYFRTGVLLDDLPQIIFSVCVLMMSRLQSAQGLHHEPEKQAQITSSDVQSSAVEVVETTTDQHDQDVVERLPSSVEPRTSAENDTELDTADVPDEAHVDQSLARRLMHELVNKYMSQSVLGSIRQRAAGLWRGLNTPPSATMSQLTQQICKEVTAQLYTLKDLAWYKRTSGGLPDDVFQGLLLAASKLYYLEMCRRAPGTDLNVINWPSDVRNRIDAMLARELFLSSKRYLRNKEFDSNATDADNQKLLYKLLEEQSAWMEWQSSPDTWVTACLRHTLVILLTYIVHTAQDEDVRAALRYLRTNVVPLRPNVTAVPTPPVAVAQPPEDGWYDKYVVTKANGNPVEPEARYFVLRIDYAGGDKIHVKSCRKALRTYIKQLRKRDHLPLLASDLEDFLDESKRT